MKDNEVHIGLEKSELRDFFSYQLGKLHESTTKNSPIFKNDDYIQYGIDNAQLMIEYYTNDKLRLESVRALTLLMKQQGWIEHDISDHTDKTNEFYIHFVGTEDEYNELLVKLNQ
jgi:cell division GTPase FtsZ